MVDFKKLKEQFPKDKVSWRAQTLSKSGNKCLAFAYIDARDVYDRLDDACGPDGWQCRYAQEKDRTYCEIGILCGDQWVWKSNAAGDTAVEKEKGAASDALKRAAVAWGIGRYLYDFENVWVACESFTGRDGKQRFSKFTEDPWNGVRDPSHFLAEADPDTGDHPAKPAQQPANSDAEQYHQNVLKAAAAAGLEDSSAFLVGCQSLVKSRDAYELGNIFAKNLTAMQPLGDKAVEQYKRVHGWMQQQHANKPHNKVAAQ